MVYFYNLIIACVFLCILTCTDTCTFNKFCYFLSTHQTNVNKFPNSFFFISYLLQLSSLNVYIDWKNQMYTHYYSYYNLSLLYIKKIRIYIVPVNPKLDYIIIILCALTTKLYLEVQLCTTCKAVNRKYYLCKMILNLLLLFLLYVWKTSLLLIINIYVLAYIFTNRTHFNTQLMLLGFEMYY